MTSLLLTLLLSAINLSASDWPILERPIYLSSHAPLAVRLFDSDQSAPVKTDILSLGPRLSSESAVVVDAASGAVLFDKNSRLSRPLASLTKLMTALVFLEAKPDLSQIVAMTPDDDREGGRTFIKPGESASLENFLKASLLASANNATITLSRSAGLASEEFIKTMNDKARALGMTSAVFVEPTGLDINNVGTARDMVKLLSAASANSTLRQLTTTRRAVIKLTDAAERPIINTDYLLNSIVNVTLGKTGYLDEALYNWAGAAKLKNNQEIYVAVLGSSSSDERFQDAKNLIVWTQGTYEWKK